MPKFDRNVLARFLPPRYIQVFEELNTIVDVDLPDATAVAQATADEARLIAAIARTNAEVLRPAVDMLQTLLLTQRSERTQIAALERRVADLETQLLALRRPVDTEQLRRQVNDLQAFQLKR